MPTPDDKPTQNILVLRDPLNLLASRVKKYRRTGALGMIGQPFIEHYLEWCRAAAAEKLPLENAIVVNFNLWVTSKTYRANLAAQLGLDFTDEGLNEVSCRGSSFDGFQYSGRAQEMKVLERYEQMMADQIFLNIVCTYEKEIRVVMETLFSAFPAKSRSPRFRPELKPGDGYAPATHASSAMVRKACPWVSFPIHAMPPTPP